MNLGRSFKAGIQSKKQRRRVATTESFPQVSLIVIDVVLPQQLKVLFLKRFLPMVFALVFDVFDHHRAEIC